MRFQIGAFFPTRDMPADRVAIRDWAQAAEAIGFDFLEVSDHVLGTDRAVIQAHSASKPGSAAAAADQSNGVKRQSAGTPSGRRT